jgi:hypothetical protein
MSVCVEKTPPNREGLQAGEELGSDQEVREGQRHEGLVSADIHHRRPLERSQHPAWLTGATWTSGYSGPMYSRVSRMTQGKSSMSGSKPVCRVLHQGGRPVVSRSGVPAIRTSRAILLYGAVKRSAAPLARGLGPCQTAAPCAGPNLATVAGAAPGVQALRGTGPRCRASAATEGATCTPR